MIWFWALESTFWTLSPVTRIWIKYTSVHRGRENSLGLGNLMRFFRRKLYLRNYSCTIHLRVSVYFNFTFSKKIVANPQMWDHWHPPTPGGEHRRSGMTPFPPFLRWLQWAEKCLALAFWGPEINVSGLQTSALMGGEHSAPSSWPNQPLGKYGPTKPPDQKALWFQVTYLE